MPHLEEFVSSLKAASEITRLRILALLAEGELSVKDITDILEQSQPRVSRHLKLLADSMLAERQAEGAWVYYRLAAEGSYGDLARDLVAALDRDDPVLENDRARLHGVQVQHGAQAAEYFATVADSWDVLRKLHVPESDIELSIVEIGSTRAPEHVVDLGTGTGRMLELLAPYYRHGTGVDSSREMVAVARAKLAESGIAHAHIRLANIGAPLENVGQADLVVLHQVLHYFDDPGRILTNACRLLRPGGGLLVVDFAPHSLEFLRKEHAHRRLGLSAEQMSAWAAAAGLEITASQEFAQDARDTPEKLTVCLWELSLKDGALPHEERTSK